MIDISSTPEESENAPKISTVPSVSIDAPYLPSMVEADPPQHLNLNPREDAYLRQLAQDIFNNKVFTDRHIPSDYSQFFPLIFTRIGLGGFSKLDPAEIQAIGLVYEYLDKASQGPLKRFPSFTSHQLLNKPDAEKVCDYYEEILKSTAPAGPVEQLDTPDRRLSL